MLNTYNISTDYDVPLIPGFFLELGAILGLWDSVSEFEVSTENLIKTKLQAMFEDKFNSFSKTFFGLDQVIPATIMVYGQNVSPLIISYLVAPLDGESVTISTNLDTSTNQTVTVNLWDDVIVTARRIKPIINTAEYEYLNCVGNDRRGIMTWNNTDNSTYEFEYYNGASWNNRYSGTGTTSLFTSSTGTTKFRIRSYRGGVTGNWYTVSYNVPSCSGGDGHPLN